MSAHTQTLIATSVIRGTRQGDSHGGVYLIDLGAQTVEQPIDWNTGAIDFQGRGWDRGLRGIAFDDDDVYIAASDELFVYGPDFSMRGSFRNPYLKHAHEISRFGRNLFITSTGYNSILAFDLDKKLFTWGLQIKGEGGSAELHGVPFDPAQTYGPEAHNLHHINNIYCDDTGMYISGRGTGALLYFGGTKITRFTSLPEGVHNARPFRNGVIMNDTEADAVRYVTPDEQIAFAVPAYSPQELTHTNLDDSRLARQRFGRGLCALSDTSIAAGSSPSTVSVYDLDTGRLQLQVNLSMDIRNAIHGLEVWPH